jgi:hypothetical protein
METPFVCPECAGEHREPADAVLGHAVICLDCAIGRGPEGDWLEFTLVEHQQAA